MVSLPHPTDRRLPAPSPSVPQALAQLCATLAPGIYSPAPTAPGPADCGGDPSRLKKELWMRRVLKLGTALIAAVALSLGGVRPAAAQTVVVPNANATVEGDINNTFPFGSVPHSATNRCMPPRSSRRSLASSPSGIAFRLNATEFPFATTYSNVRFDVSTTSAAPRLEHDLRLKRWCGQYHGAQRVASPFRRWGWESPPPSISSSRSPPRSSITQCNRNLLLDIRKFSGGSGRAFDAVGNGLPNTSRQ